MKKNICIVAGARPNFVKVAPLLRAIHKSGELDCHLVYAGCEDDPTLEPSLFDDLQMQRPDFYLGVDSESLNEITSRVMGEFDRFLDTHPTDVVIVVDDLASTMAAAIVTKKRGLRLAHLVAGTRSFDINMPKEINRLVIDALSDYLFTAGVRSTGIATREQSESSQTYLVGNILMDTLRFNHDRLQRPALMDNVSDRYIVFTLNRRALLADEEKMQRMVKAMTEAAGDVPIIAPLRPSAAKVISSIFRGIMGEDMYKAYCNYVKAVQNGEDDFEVKDEHTYDWMIGQFPSQFHLLYADYTESNYAGAFKNGRATFAFGGENSGFTGPLHVGADGNDDYVTLRISSKANIGGNPPAREGRPRAHG